MSRVKIDRPKKMSIAGGRGNRRPHHRATLITTTRSAFNRFMRMKVGEVMQVECPNDIVSSARGGSSVIHHSIRRSELIRNAVRGGFKCVKVRCEMGNEIPAIVAGKITGSDDSCSFWTELAKV